MKESYEYLLFVLLYKHYTDYYSCNLNTIHEIVKKTIREILTPICCPDLLKGNFIVDINNNNLILYKVIEIQDNFFYISHFNKLKVLYVKDNNQLSCNCTELKLNFYYKISALDIIQMIERENPYMLSFSEEFSATTKRDSIDITKDKFSNKKNDIPSMYTSNIYEHQINKTRTITFREPLEDIIREKIFKPI
jgi:hypothetical protein